MSSALKSAPSGTGDGFATASQVVLMPDDIKRHMQFAHLSNTTRSPPGGAGPSAVAYSAPSPAAASMYGAHHGYAPPHLAFSTASPSRSGSFFMGRGQLGKGQTPPDVEAQVMHAFAEAAVRRGFVRKVLAIVMLQLLVTVGFSLICIFVTPIKTYVRSTPWPFYLSWALAFGLILVIACNEGLRRKHPINIILLGLITLAQAFLVGMISSFWDIEVVALAFICMCVGVAIMALVACTSKLDFTSWLSGITVMFGILIVLLLVGIFWVSRVWYLVIAGVGALVACAFLAADLQLIMGGKQFQISPDEYIMAALSIYLDVVNLFLWLLTIIGLARQ